MAHEDTAVRGFWEARATAPRVGEEAVTHPDVWQRWLEVENIKDFLRPKDRVLDVGCGNGWTTIRIAPLVGEIVGIDTSSGMVARARQAAVDLAGRATFHARDVLDLDPADFGLFDVALSERCLINLPGWPEQKRAIANIASVLKPGGRFIFVEGSRQGRERLNALREAVGLETMPPVWHNVDFDEEETLRFLERHFDVEVRRHFGVYDFVSRIIHPLMVAPEPPQYQSRFNEAAAMLARQVDAFAEASRVLFLVLRKLTMPSP
jgi:SAM-dependent methyltransferase